MKQYLIILLVLVSKIGFAHQADLSTVIISKTENDKIVLQITSSLTAFQNEVNYNNPKDSYKSPEDFQNLVIDHFQKRFSIILNEKDTLDFINPIVLLGHETKLITEIIGIPEQVNSIRLKNEVFKDIHNNQSTVIFSLEGFPTQQNYVLSNDNNHQVNIALQDGNWQEIKVKNSSFLKFTFFILIAIIIGGIAYWFIKRKEKNIKK